MRYELIRKKRIQLTLFVAANFAVEIEAIRGKYNSIQYQLIKGHVTLCREDELMDIDKIMNNLRAGTLNSIPICFAPPIRFADGKGVMLLGMVRILNFIN